MRYSYSALTAAFLASMVLAHCGSAATIAPLAVANPCPSNSANSAAATNPAGATDAGANTVGTVPSYPIAGSSSQVGLTNAPSSGVAATDNSGPAAAASSGANSSGNASSNTSSNTSSVNAGLSAASGILGFAAPLIGLFGGNYGQAGASIASAASSLLGSPTTASLVNSAVGSASGGSQMALLDTASASGSGSASAACPNSSSAANGT